MLAVFVIDCGEHSLLRRLAAEGRMPVLQSLLERGCSIPLTSDAAVIDGGVFQTLLTGVGPGEHGMYKYRQLVPGTYRFERSRAEDCPVPQIWTSLSHRGRRCCVFDVPKAFPSKGFLGQMVASWGAYSPAARPASVPPNLGDDIHRTVGPHPQRSQVPVPATPQEYAQVRDRLIEAARLRADACRLMLEREPCDFFVTAFSESHVASHQFWHLRDAGHPLYDAEAAACSDALERICEAIDSAIGRVIESLPADAHVVVLTQQGVTDNFSGSPCLASWLTRRAGHRKTGRRSPIVQMVSWLGNSLRSRLARSLPPPLIDRWLAWKYRPKGDVFLLPGSEFMAFLRVNLEGREPEGTVRPERYDSLLAELQEGILALRNTDTGEPAAAEVLRTHETFPGRLAHVLPDLIVCWRNDAPVRALACPTYGVLEPALQFTGMTCSSHTGEGLAVLAGPGIAPCRVADPHPLPDLTATLYRLLDESPPPHIQGEPIDLHVG